MGDLNTPVVFGDAVAVDLSNRLRQAKDMGLATDAELTHVFGQLKWIDQQIEVAEKIIEVRRNEIQREAGKREILQAQKIALSTMFGNRIHTHELQMREKKMAEQCPPVMIPSDPSDKGTPPLTGSAGDKLLCPPEEKPVDKKRRGKKPAGE